MIFTPGNKTDTDYTQFGNVCQYTKDLTCYPGVMCLMLVKRTP